jgi:hypothetical protein
MSAKLTPWFPPEVKPVHVGQYQRDYDDLDDDDPCTLMPDLWDGEHWVILDRDGNFAVRAATDMRWRGLASNPAEAAQP